MQTKTCVRSRVFLLLLVLFLFLPTSLFALEKQILNTSLNNEEKGEAFVYITAYGDVLLLKSDISDLGIIAEGKETVVENETYVSLRSLNIHGITYSIDEQALTLSIRAEPKAFQENLVGLERKIPKGTEYIEQNSAFLNYTLELNFDEQYDRKDLNAPFEAALRYKKYLLYSNFSYHEDKTDKKFLRQFTNVTRDDTKRMVRYIAGDFNASTGELGSGAPIGGLSISRNFSLNPYFLRYPGMDLSGQLMNASEVELWIDGSLVSKQSLPPGAFVFQNIPLTTGIGEAELLIRDSFGREERITVPFYFSSTILKKGIHEFSYNAGFMRHNLGVKNGDYGKAAFLASHRYGLFDFMTAGYRAEGSSDVESYGLNTTLVLGPLGYFDAAGAKSKDSLTDRSGTAYSFGYTYSKRKYGFNLRSTIRGYSRDYANLSLLVDDDKPKYELLSSISYGNPLLGTLSLSYSKTDYYVDQGFKKYTARYSRSLYAGTSFDITGNLTDKQNDYVREVFATVRFMLGTVTTGSVGYKNEDGIESNTVTLQKTPLYERGLGYRFLSEGKENIPRSYDAEAAYYASKGILTARYNELNDSETYTLRATGSVAAVRGIFDLGQPVRDAFAIAKVGSLENVNVLFNGSPAGKTSARGNLLLPRLMSYDSNKISVNDEEVPLGTTLTNFTRLVTPPYRGGILVDFGVEKLQAITGNIFILQNGKETPAEFWTIGASNKGGVAGSPLIQNGEFYLENLTPGSHEAVILSGDSMCMLEINVPESQEPLLNIGKIVCERVVAATNDSVEKILTSAPSTAPSTAALSAATVNTPQTATTGKIVISELGRVYPASSWALTVERGTASVTTTLADDGGFKLENFSPGSYAASVTDPERTSVCGFILELPPTAASDIGRITCGIRQPLGVSESGKYYTVQVGAFRDKENAEKRALEFSSRGYETAVYSNGFNRVVIGKYDSRSAAVIMARRIKTIENVAAVVISIVPETDSVSIEDADEYTFFSSQIGAFALKENADALFVKLEAKGYKPFIYHDKYYRVLAGRFDVLTDARDFTSKLASDGYPEAIPVTIGKEGRRPAVEHKELGKRYYSVQTGAFRDISNARARAEILEKAGYDSYVLEGSLNRVLVSKTESIDEATKTANLIVTREGLDAIIVSLGQGAEPRPIKFITAVHKIFTVFISEFSARTEAEKLLKDLRELGYDSFIYEEGLFKVCVGRFENEADAAKTAARLNSSMKLHASTITINISGSR